MLVYIREMLRAGLLILPSKKSAHRRRFSNKPELVQARDVVADAGLEVPRGYFF